MSAQTSQLPVAGQLFLDHVGHFVDDVEAARAALVRAGFQPTPVSVQVNPDPAGGAPRKTGTGNVCAMLSAGYLEVLFKTADTPLGAEFDAAYARYQGLHLAAFAVADADAAHARLAEAGFAMQPVVDMRRPVATADGTDVAAFSVVRFASVGPAGGSQMPEGRLQMLRHLTESAVWQPRWLGHPNTATGLVSLTIAVADLPEAAQRYLRFFGREGEVETAGRTGAAHDSVKFHLDRGMIELCTAGAFTARWPRLDIPDLPFMGVCGIAVASLPAAERVLGTGGLEVSRDGADRLVAMFPRELGQGMWIFEERAT